MQVKKLNLDIFALAPVAKFSPWVFLSAPRQREITYSPSKRFLHLKPCPPSRREEDQQVIRWQCSLLSLNKEFHSLLLFCTNLNRRPFHSLFLLHVLSIDLFREFLIQLLSLLLLQSCVSYLTRESFSPAQISF